MVYHNNGLNLFSSFCIQELHLHMNEEYQCHHQCRGWIWYACHTLYFWPFKNIKDENDCFLNWCKNSSSLFIFSTHVTLIKSPTDSAKFCPLFPPMINKALSIFTGYPALGCLKWIFCQYGQAKRINTCIRSSWPIRISCNCLHRKMHFIQLLRMQCNLIYYDIQIGVISKCK